MIHQGDNTGPSETPLTDEEQRSLARALSLAEKEILRRVTKKLWGLAITIGVLLTFLGFTSVREVAGIAVEKASLSLASDQAIRSAVIDRATEKLDEVAAVTQRAKELNREVIDTEGRITHGMMNELTRIQRMLDQIQRDTSELKRSNTADTSAVPKELNRK